jgi:hypothetical protein
MHFMPFLSNFKRSCSWKNALEVIIRDIFSNYRTVEFHELIPDPTAKQYDRILTQTIYKHIFSASDICRLLFIVDHSKLFPDASTKYRILNNFEFKISFPLLQPCLYQIRENALAIICPNDLPVSDNLIWAARKSFGKTLTEIDQVIQKEVDQHNNNVYYGKYCFGRTPKQTLEEGKWLVKQGPGLLKDIELLKWEAVVGRWNTAHHHPIDCECEFCWFTRDSIQELKDRGEWYYYKVSPRIGVKN